MAVRRISLFQWLFIFYAATTIRSLCKKPFWMSAYRVISCLISNLFEFCSWKQQNWERGPIIFVILGGDCGLAYIIKSTMFTFTIRTTACPAHDPSGIPLRPSIVNLNHHFRIQLLAPRSKAHQSAFQSILIIHYGNQESNRCCARKEGRCRPSACILQRYVVAAYGSTKLSHRFGHDYISVAYMC